MIADTTFLIHLVREHRTGRAGPARSFLAANRRERIRTCIISLAEVAVSFSRAHQAWAYFGRWTIYRLHDGIAQAAADLDRELALAPLPLFGLLWGRKCLEIKPRAEKVCTTTPQLAS
jgi:hypothetical protein